MNSNTANRITATTAVAVLVVFATVLGLMTHRPQQDTQKRPSTFFTDNTGARALFLTMQKVLPRVEQWRQPLTLLRDVEGTNFPATLIVAGPEWPLSKGEANRLLSWVGRGGQLLLLSEEGWEIHNSKSALARLRETARSGKSASPPKPGETDTFLSRLGVQLSHPAPGGRKEPSAESRPVQALTSGKRRSFHVSTGFKWEGKGRPLLQAGAETIALEIPWGQGRVIALGDPGFVSNQGQRQSDNAIWLVNLCARWGNGGVLWDEYHHGFAKTRSATDLSWSFLKTSWGWCVLQLLLAGALYAFLFRRRMGRIHEPPPAQPQSALNLIQARAGLFQAARARGLAADVMVQNFCHELGATKAGSEEFLAFCRAQQARHQPGPLAGLFQELAELYQKNQAGLVPPEMTLHQLGRVCGQIHQELTRER